MAKALTSDWPGFKLHWGSYEWHKEAEFFWTRGTKNSWSTSAWPPVPGSLSSCMEVIHPRNNDPRRHLMSYHELVSSNSLQPPSKLTMWRASFTCRRGSHNQVSQDAPCLDLTSLKASKGILMERHPKSRRKIFLTPKVDLLIWGHHPSCFWVSHFQAEGTLTFTRDMGEGKREMKFNSYIRPYSSGSAQATHLFCF